MTGTCWLGGVLVVLSFADGKGPNPTPVAHTRQPQEARAAALGTSSALAVALLRADVVYGRSLIAENALKGGVTEAFMVQHIARVFRTKDNWQPISARLGPQGIDGLQVRYNAIGEPMELLVLEAKYGQSRLGKTRDGFQLSKAWTARRLHKMGTEYRSFALQAKAGSVTVSRMPGPSTPTQRLELRMRDGKAAVAWRPVGDLNWRFAGLERQIADSGKRFDELATFLQKAAREEFPVHRVLFQMQPTGQGLQVKLSKAHDLDAGPPKRLGSPIHISARRDHVFEGSATGRAFLEQAARP